MLDLCSQLRLQKFVIPGSINCWIEDLKEFIITKGETVPLKAQRFEYYLQRWVEETEKGKVALSNQLVVFSIGNVIMTKVRCLTSVSNEMTVA